MSTLKNCISRQIRLQKLESDHQQEQQQTNVKDRAQSSRSKIVILSKDYRISIISELAGYN